MSREPSSANSDQGREFSVKDKLVQEWNKMREGFTPGHGAGGRSEGNPSKPEHENAIPAEPLPASSGEHNEDGALNDQEPTPGGEAEVPLDGEFAVAPPDESDVHSTRDEDEVEQPSEMAEPHVAEPGTSDGMAGNACPTEPTDAMSDGEDAPEAAMAEPADDKHSTSEQEAEPEAGSGDHLNGDAETDIPPHDGESFADEADKTIEGPDIYLSGGGDDLEEVILEPQSEDGSLKLGVLHMMGNVHYVVTECLPRGYYRGHNELEDETQSVLFHLSPLSHRELWRDAGSKPSHVARDPL